MPGRLQRPQVLGRHVLVVRATDERGSQPVAMPTRTASQIAAASTE